MLGGRADTTYLDIQFRDRYNSTSYPAHDICGAGRNEASERRFLGSGDQWLQLFDEVAGEADHKRWRDVGTAEF